MRSYIVVGSLLLSGCAVLLSGCAIAESPVGPSPPVVVREVIMPSVLRGFFGPAELFSGGATQVHVGAYGYDAAGVLQRVSDVAVSFRSDGGRLLVLNGRTSLDNDAVALLEVDRTTVDYVVTVTAEAGQLAQVLRVPVCACLSVPVPAPTPPAK